jgi:hypothetical protein
MAERHIFSVGLECYGLAKREVPDRSAWSCSRLGMERCTECARVSEQFTIGVHDIAGYPTAKSGCVASQSRQVLGGFQRTPVCTLGSPVG